MHIIDEGLELEQASRDLLKAHRKVHQLAEENEALRKKVANLYKALHAARDSLNEVLR